MSESDRVDHDVRAWYADASRWAPQGKSTGWPDRVLLDQGALIDDKDVLNLGCFYPEDEEQLGVRARSWMAIDFTPEVIKRCRAHGPWPEHVQFWVADMRCLPLLDATFDVVTDFSSGDHLLREDWLRTVREVCRVLRPGGHFLVCFANRTAFQALGPSWNERPEQYGDYGYVRTDTPDEMTRMLTTAGFEEVRRSHTTELRAGILVRKPGP